METTSKSDTDLVVVNENANTTNTSTRSVEAISMSSRSTSSSKQTSMVANRGSSVISSSGDSSPFKMVYWIGILLRVAKDITTFLVRGGLSVLMFFMDQALTSFLVLIQQLPGSAFIGPLLRALMWTFQLAIWATYIMFELMFYLPWKLLLLYVMVLFIFYLFMPESANTVISTMVSLEHSFLHLVRRILY